MTNRLMMSVAAAALIAGSGFAYAQGTGMGREGSTAGSTVQPGASSSGNSPAATNRDAKESKGRMRASQSEPKTPAGAKSQHVQDEMKSGPKSAQENTKGENSKRVSSENDNARGSKEMKAEGREGRNGNMSAETRSQTTVGQAGAGAKLSTEQRSRITTIIREQHAQPVAHVDFDIRPGVRITREHVALRPLPPDVVTIYPQWRGYEFFLVNDRIVVVNPRTLEIVDVIDV